MTWRTRLALLSFSLLLGGMPACGMTRKARNEEARQKIASDLLTSRSMAQKPPGDAQIAGGKKEAGIPPLLDPTGLAADTLPATKPGGNPEPASKGEGLLASPLSPPLNPESGSLAQGGFSMPVIQPAASSPPKPIQQALQAFLKDDPDQAIQYLNGYDPAYQQLLLGLLPIIAGVDKADVASSKLSGEEILNVMESIHSSLVKWQEHAPLKIEKLVFCRGVKGYGVYDPLPTTTFRPGDNVQLYVELKNLADRRDKNQIYVTNLSCHLEIRNLRGEVVWEQPVPVAGAGDRSRSPRNDHWTWIPLTLPPLNPANYTLRVRIVDLDTQREAEQRIDFRSEPMAKARRTE